MGTGLRGAGVWRPTRGQAEELLVSRNAAVSRLNDVQLEFLLAHRSSLTLQRTALVSHIMREWVRSWGSVKLTEMAHSPGRRSVRARSAGARHLIPEDEGARSQQTVVDRAEQMSAHAKEVLNGSVHREKSLRVGSRLEATHLAFPLPSRLAGDFHPIVRVMVGAMNHERHYGAEPRGVTAQFVHDQSSRDTALSF